MNNYMRRPNVLMLLAVLSVLLSPGPIVAEESSRASLGKAYPSQIQPLLARYCHDCHGDEVAEGEINLAMIAGWDDAAEHPQLWQKVAEMLGNGLMPPEDAEQPTVPEREQLERWVRDYLTLEAQAHAGDPGKVVLRRLSNAEYTYTLRDLTGVESLDPAREFPADGAAGEGFTNTGNALVMSPALVTKYLDAAKQVAEHAVLLPDGFRFSPNTTARDWTDEMLAQIRAFYGQFTDASGGSQVNLQGVVFDTNQGGRLPIEKYVAATLEQREALTTGSTTIEAVARERGLNAKYLGILWASLNGAEPSVVLDEFRSKWRAAKPEECAALVSDVQTWQKALWSFASVGLIGREGGPTRWMEPVDPVATRQEIRFQLPDAPDGGDIAISLIATDAADGNEGDFAIWKSPRLVAPGQPDLMLRDVRSIAGTLKSRRNELFAGTTKYLAAADEATSSQATPEIAALASKHGVDEANLQAWLNYLGIGAGSAVEIQGHFNTKLENVGGYDFVKGWGTNDTPLLITNSSDQHVRVPGNMRPHSVAVHPSPTLRAAVGWRSPITATVRIEAAVTSAHPECGNGVTWLLELRRGNTRQRLAEGKAQGPNEVKVGPLQSIAVRAGDVIALSIGPRDGNHSCDLAAIDLKVVATDNSVQAWNLADDVSGDVQAANPHGDRLGNADVWHFYTEPDNGAPTGPAIPADSVLAKWQVAMDAPARQSLALEVQQLLTSRPPADKDSPDAALYRQLASMRGPLLGGLIKASETATNESSDLAVGLDPALFSRHPDGGAIDAADLCVRAPAVIEFRLPADLAAGCELVTTGSLDPEAGAEGTVQLTVVAGNSSLPTGLLRGETTATSEQGVSWSRNKRFTNSAPILVTAGSAAERRVQAAFEDFRNLFPPALCYTKIVPVDEVISVTLFYREDDHLARLMLDDEQKQRLAQMWDELRFISRDAFTSVDAFEQLLEFASQDADPKVFEPLRKPTYDRAAAFRQQLLDCEPAQVESLVDFAALAYRRPLTESETNDLQALYDRLRQEEIQHEDAFRLTLARIMVSPAFLYRIEKPVAGEQQGPISDWELASRLSYFLWASQPDAELRQLAASGRLHEPNVLVEQMNRMLRDPKIRRLANEFACHWLHIDGFENLNEKSERHFPTFADLRDEMAEESTLFFTDLFQNDGSVLDILDADYTFLNEPLAQHYGIPGVVGTEWRRVDGVKQFARGGILAQATTLATQSGASRTSPILRGTWISEVLLGERLPKPPPGVPILPDDEAATEGLTVRQLVEKHTTDPKCAVCHRRIDPYGFALEAFDAIGRHRDKDLGDRPIDTRATTMDGAQFDGLDGLRSYLLHERREAFVRQFAKKLLGYALGRAVQLSDEPLLTQTQHDLAANDYKVSTAIHSIILSPQFQQIRGMQTAFEE